VRFRRRPFDDVIRRQLELFAEEDLDALDDVADALARYNAAGADEAEELYGDYQLAIEAATDRLAVLRDSFAATLDDRDPYTDAFNRAVVRRWPELALTIEES
jgi:hypothetical protein